MSTIRPITLGLAGGMCSGKNTFGQFVVDVYGPQRGGGKVVSSSDAARTYIEQEKLGDPTRDLTRVVSTELRRKHSPHYLVNWALKQFSSEGIRIVAGIYTPEEALRIREVGGLVVAILAEEDVREIRMVGRHRAGEVEAEEFRRLDQEDMKGSVTDQNLSEVLSSPDITIYDTPDYLPVYASAAREIIKLHEER